MQLIRPFSQIGKADAAIAGGKGASLGEMTQAGLPVPPGFVILSAAFEQFLEEADLNQEIDTIILHGVNREEMHTVERASEKIQQLILEAKMSEVICSSILQNYRTLGAEYVAVRSSATAEDSQSAAWAGQLDTFLNTTEENLLVNVQKCWASLFTSRAIFYRFEKNMHDKKISVAVIVQKMIESEVSGIVFSVHPVTQDANQMIIEAGFGLGEAIVSGQITPDSYVVEKNPRRIIDINIATQTRALHRAPARHSLGDGGNGSMGGNEWRELSEAEGKKPTLSNEQILELAEMILRIENHYGFPCDVEWALEKGTFYITQSRPITTLTNEKTDYPSSGPLTNFQFTLHWTQTDISMLMVDIMCNPDAYGMIDYVYIMEDGIVRAYLTEHGLKEFYNIGRSLLDPVFFNELIQDANEMERRIDHYKPPRLTKGTALAEWERLGELWNDFWRIYKYSDEFAHKPLEEMLLKEHSPHKISELLLESDTGAALNDITRYAIAVLKTIGQKKLDLHLKADLLIRGDEAFAKFFEHTYGIPRIEFFALRKNEIGNTLRGKNTSADIARARLEGCAFVRQEDEWISVTGADFLDWKRRIESTEPKKISGKVAYRGRVLGRVIKHLSWTRITEMPEGSVLVTGMTNPQMIPHLKNIVAIVTDEGGLTCHAAIISRELKIPCIVGTKVATKLLKDGDVVEVDANNGIVRIVK